MLSLKCDHIFLCEFSILFSTVKLKLRQNVSQFIHGFKIWILKFWSWAVLCILPSFFQFIKEKKMWIFEKPRLHLQIFPNSLKSLKLRFLSPCLFIFGQMVRMVFQCDICQTGERIYD